MEITWCFSLCVITSVARARRWHLAVAGCVINEGHSSLDYRHELGQNSVSIVRGYLVLGLCTEFSNCFCDTITTLKIFGNYCLNGGLYYKVHVIVEFRASGCGNAGCWRLGEDTQSIFTTKVHVLTQPPRMTSITPAIF